MSGDEKTHYETLGVDTAATSDEIKKATRRLLQTHHPDRGGDPALAARINTAHWVLTNPARRDEYDSQLHAEPAAGGAQAPDPDSYEDDWGTDQPWEPSRPSPAAPAPEEEEVLDLEVEDEPPPAPAPQTAPVDTPDPPSPKRTVVRTAKRQALLIGLLPAAVMLAFVALESSMVAPPSTSPLIFPAVGLIAALLALGVLQRRGRATYPGRRGATASMTVTGLAVAAMAAFAQDNPLLVPAVQSFLAVSVGAWITSTASSRHRHAARIISSAGLREDGTLFGASTGDTAGELLNRTIWSCLARPELHAARGFQTSDPANPFTKAVLLGDRVALIRPLFLPRESIPSPGPAFYWSPPSLFLRSSASGVPVPVVRLDLSDYRAAFRSTVGELSVEEFLVVYTSPGSPSISLPAEAQGSSTVVAGDDAEEVIARFLTDGARAVHYVDHQAAVKTLMGLEYRLRTP